MYSSIAEHCINRPRVCLSFLREEINPVSPVAATIDFLHIWNHPHKRPSFPCSSLLDPLHGLAPSPAGAASVDASAATIFCVFKNW